MARRRWAGCLPGVLLLLAFVPISYQSPNKPEWVTVVGLSSLLAALVLLGVLVIRTGWRANRDRGLFYRGPDEWWEED